MSSLDDPTIKMKYQKCKLRVKRWESDFMERHGRKPKKNDIRSADISIKEAYKMYWNLKTQALEETLLDITFSDDIATNVSVNQSFDNSLLSENIENIVNKSVNITPSKNLKNIIDTRISSTPPRNIGNIIKQSVNATPPKNIENIVPGGSPLKNNSLINLPSEHNLINIDGAWGSHLNKDKFTTKNKKNLPIGKSSSFQLSQNKFTSSTFAKRNPRKSLSTSRIKIKSNLNKPTTQTQDTKDIQCNEMKHNIQSFLSESVKITQQEIKIKTQPINPIQQLVNSGSTVVERNINAGWLDRCSKENNLEPVTPSQQRLSGVSDSGIESMDLSDHTPPESTQINKPKIAEISDDDDFVCISDTEEQSRNKRMRNWGKTLSETISQPIKRLCTENIIQITSSPLSNHLSSDIESVFSNTKDNHGIGTVKDAQETEIVSTKSKKEGNVEISINPTGSKNIKRGAIKKKQVRKSKVNDSNDEIEKPKTRKLRVARSTLVTITAQTKNKSRMTRSQKGIQENKRVTRRTTRKNVSSEDEKVTSSEILNNPDIPIYSVESLDVVPRFAVPTDTTGDLINDLYQSTVVNEMAKITNKTVIKSKNAMTEKEKLEAKVAAGKANENFVRINLKKKVFVRGKKSFNYSKYKKNEWKQKKKGLESSEGSLDLADLAEKNVCFKCGDSGHMSKKCPVLKGDELLPLDENESSDFPTIQEAEKMASQEAKLTHQIDKPLICSSFTNSTAENIVLENEDIGTFDDVNFDDKFEEKKSTRIVGHKIPQDLVDKLLPPINGKIDPLYPMTADGSIMKTPEEVFETLKMFGHTSFRPGQEKTIMRILSGQSTLVTLSTGSGKSLCYQLPAYLYAKRSHCITLVVSPLVSLMDDQVIGIPRFISAAALHTGQTPKVREKIMETIKEGKLDILLVSPEAIVAGEKSTGFGSFLRQLPPIAFVCIDEAHCISQWSHNFRPSYLMICRVLMEKMGVKTILGLTATATRNTADSIVSHLCIPDGINGVISDIPLPTNLILTVSKDEQRDRALINLLNSKRFENCDSVIIYCTRREECTRIAGLLRVSLQDIVNTTKLQEKNKAKVSSIAEAYHAGLVASRRKTIQKAFMNGDIRIIVATVAFGMGINKSNIRSVIHYNMPSNFEGYVQEVGRAGRDNLPAQCHLFLSPKEDSDKWELRRHIYADCVDRHIIRRLLQKVFIPCSCRGNGRKCPGHEVAIPIDDTVRLLDVSEETISTLLCYLELHPKKFITVLSSVYVNAKISSYNGPKSLKKAAQSSPPLAMAIALDVKKGNDHENSSVIEFNVIDVAAAIGWDSGVVKSHLKNLEWDKTDGKYKRTPISVRYDTLGLRVRAPGDLTDTELDEALDALWERSRLQQTSALQQLAAIHASLNKYSHVSVRDCMELNEATVEKSENLKNVIRQYFQLTSPLSIIDIPPEICNKINEDQVINDIRALICSYRDNNFTGRAVARIFHGIQSPNYSALTWSRCRFWRAHLPVDFNWITQIATREILSMR